MTVHKVLTAIRRYSQTLLACCYFFAGGFLRRKHRGLLYILSRYFGFEHAPIATIPTLSIRDTVGSIIEAHLTACEETDGNVSFLELAVISALVRLSQPRICFEIGTFDGRTTLNMAMNAPDGCQVFTLDLPMSDKTVASLALEANDLMFIQKPASGTRFRQHPLEKCIRQLYGDSATFDLSEFHNRIDFMFIDGSHSYDYVRTDSLNALKLVRHGGVIVWHDYDTPHWHGLTRALNELHEQIPEFRHIRHIEGTSLCILRRKPEVKDQDQNPLAPLNDQHRPPVLGIIPATRNILPAW